MQLRAYLPKPLWRKASETNQNEGRLLVLEIESGCERKWRDLIIGEGARAVIETE